MTFLYILVKSLILVCVTLFQVSLENRFVFKRKLRVIAFTILARAKSNITKSEKENKENQSAFFFYDVKRIKENKSAFLF